MTLTKDDLAQIRGIVEDVVDTKLEQKLDTALERKLDTVLEQKLDTKFREFAQDLDDKIDKKLEPIYGELEAIRNDLRDIYSMLSEMDKRIGQKSILDPGFAKLSDKEQLLRLNDILLSTAKRLKVELPR